MNKNIYIFVVIFIFYTNIKSIHDLYVDTYIAPKAVKNKKLSSSEKYNLFIRESVSNYVTIPFSIILLYLTWKSLILRIFFIWVLLRMLLFKLYYNNIFVDFCDTTHILPISHVLNILFAIYVYYKIFSF